MLYLQSNETLWYVQESRCPLWSKFTPVNTSDVPLSRLAGQLMPQNITPLNLLQFWMGA